MIAQLIDGRAIAEQMRADIRARVERLAQAGVIPGLAVVLAGDNPASQVYVRMKAKACAQMGIRYALHTLPDPSQGALEELCGTLSADPDVHGIIVQLPLPGGLNPFTIMNYLDPEKDVDGFHPINVGRLSTGEGGGFLPCTPAGVIELIKRTGCPIAGAKAVVVGRSNIVGKPTAMLLLQENATVTQCHSRTADLSAQCRAADILVVAVGVPRLVKGDWIKPGAVVIDVGMNRLPEGLVGDVDYAAALAVAGHITPVPGGVGPMTITMLLANAVMAAERVALKAQFH